MGLVRYFPDLKTGSATAVDQGDCPHGWQDALAHPDIRRMSLREIADLPFDRTATGHRRYQQS